MTKSVRAGLMVLLACGAAACDNAVAPDGDGALLPELQAARAAAAGGGPATAEQNRLLAEVRRATARFHRVEVAEAEGYVRGAECVASPMGGMGYHYVKGPLIDGTVDATQPEALVYEPMKNGRMQLVAVEYIVRAADWDPHHAGAPHLGMQEFDDHRAPGSPGPPFPHYQLHAWVWKHNPLGMYVPFNPVVSCAHAVE
jgi:hypothetical protein